MPHCLQQALPSLRGFLLLGRPWKLQVHFILVEAFASFKDMHEMSSVMTAACYTLCCPVLTCNSMLCKSHSRIMSKLSLEAWNAHRSLLMAV